MSENFQRILFEELRLFFEPVLAVEGDPEQVFYLFRMAGWDLHTILDGNDAAFMNSFQGVVAAVSIVDDLIEDPPESLTDLGPALNAALRLLESLRSLPNAISGTRPPQIDQMIINLLEQLTLLYLLKKSPLAYSLLEFLTIIHTRTDDYIVQDGVIIGTASDLPHIDFGRITDLLSDPGGVFEQEYWPDGFTDLETTNKVAERLFGRIAAVLSALRIAVFVGVPPGVDLTPEQQERMRGMATFQKTFPNVVSGATVGIGVSVGLLPESEGGPGVTIVPMGTFQINNTVGDWGISIRVEGGGQALQITGSGAQFFGGGAASYIAIELALSPTDGEGPAFLVGSTTGTRLELKDIEIKGRAVFRGDETDEYKFQIRLDQLALVIAAGDGDGFLKQVLPPDGVRVAFDLLVGWSNRAGFYFEGGGGLEVALPLHLDILGIIQARMLKVAIRVDGRGLNVQGGLDAQLTLGPLMASVENIGLSSKLTFPPDGGNLGPLNMGLGFKPPNGIGLAIDAGVVKGGGYLYFDFDKGEYAGALELTISNWLSLKAIGLINTKMPGGQPGFSLLVIITAEFNPGFQLGYGFVLLGVGGLLGLNRTMLLDPLVQGVRTGAVNSIVFPTNIVANAPKILSDLRTIFPPQEGIFLIGPMAKIGWTTLITLSLGVIIEIPGDVVILGRLGLILPTAEDPVLVLQVSFVGALEFDKRRIWFFATLFESRVLFITLDGEMGLLMDFSDNPNFVLSVGGFHPRFTAPPLPFPSPARIALSILNESWGRLRAETYFAITSNSVQMGCSIDAFFGYDAFSIEGFFSFDALLRFSPFYLIVEISTGFSLKVFGMGVFNVRLRGSLEGPTPWHIHGSVEISFLFFSFSADVDRTFGEERTDTLPPIEVLPKIRAEFEKLESWRATLPASGQLFVNLRDLGSAGTLVLHPVGRLQISQRFAPLNLPLDKIGNQKPSDVKKVTVAVTTSALAIKGPTKEKFAAAQYREMDDAAKLSAPAYEPLESGVELGAASQTWATGPLAQRNVRYETIILDTAFMRLRIRFFEFWSGLFTHFRAGAAVSRAGISLANEKRMQPFASKVAVFDDQYTVAFQSDNRTYTSTATFSSYAEAQVHMAEAVQLDPALSEEIHVIPLAEVNQAL